MIHIDLRHFNWHSAPHKQSNFNLWLIWALGVSPNFVGKQTHRKLFLMGYWTLIVWQCILIGHKRALSIKYEKNIYYCPFEQLEYILFKRICSKYFYITIWVWPPCFSMIKRSWSLANILIWFVCSDLPFIIAIILLIFPGNLTTSIPNKWIIVFSTEAYDFRLANEWRPTAKLCGFQMNYLFGCVRWHGNRNRKGHGYGHENGNGTRALRFCRGGNYKIWPASQVGQKPCGGMPVCI